MDYLDAVRRYVSDAYPTERSFGKWRASANIAAVNLLRNRVQSNQYGGTRTVVEFLLNGTRPLPQHDPEVAELAATSNTGFFTGESRLEGLLNDLRAALAIATDLKEYHLQRIWGANTILITGILADTELNTLGWLSYFYKERGNFANLTNEDKVWLVDFLNVFYTLPAVLALRPADERRFENAVPAGQFLNQGTPLPKRMDNGQTVFERLSNFTNENITHEYKVKRDVFRRALDAMLRSGFVPIAQTNENHSITGSTAADPILPSYARWAPNTAARVQAAVRTTHVNSFGWRGESRTYEQVRLAGGLWCKAASEGYATAINMRKHWHPFSDMRKRNYAYFRCNQDDNCLYTAVSMTPAVTLEGMPQTFQFNNPNINAFKINVTFPQLEEIPVADRRLVRIRITLPDGRNAIHHCTVDEVQLFLCSMPANTRYVDTHHLQGGNAFPEIALRGVPYRNIVGYLKFIRVHHGSNNPAGFTAIPVDDRSRNLATTNAAASHLYTNANVQFEAAWGPNGPIPPNNVWTGQWTINRVGQMDVGGNGHIAQYINYR